jgi:uncharacterized membrane protein YdcZ (DUF606 family)
VTSGVLLALVIGTVIPAVTAVATKLSSNVKTKALVAAGLSVITGVACTYLTTPPRDTKQWEQLIGYMLVAWIASSGAYVAAWKPSHAAAVLNEHTPAFGFGAVGSNAPESSV